MFHLSAYLSRYHNWCKTCSKGWRLWQIVALYFFGFLGMFPVAKYLGGPIWVAYFLIFLGPVQHFAFVAADNWVKRLEKEDEQYKQLKKTQKLLKGFRR